MKVLLFVGYQFSWFSWVGQTTKCSSQRKGDFHWCVYWKLQNHEFNNSRTCVSFLIHEKCYPRNKELSQYKLSFHLWHIRSAPAYVVSYHNLYVMQKLAITTQTFCIVLDFLQLGFCNKVMLLQDLSHHYRSFMNWWIVTVYPSALWKLICSTCHGFHVLFRLPRTSFFMSNSVGDSRKAQDAYSIVVPCPCSQFLVESELLIYFC